MPQGSREGKATPKVFDKIGKKRKITWWTRLGFGMGGMLSSGALTFTHTYMILFLTTEVGLPAEEAALIAAFALYLDAILAPLMGFISDNFYSTKIGRKFGRRRFWVLIAIPMMIAEPLIFLVTPFGFPYYFAMYIIYNFGYSFASSSMGPLTIEMTDNFEDRSYLTGSKHMFGNVTGFLMAALTAFGFGVFGETNAFSYEVIAAINATIMVVALIGVYLSTWEHSPEEVAEEALTGVWQAVKKLVIDVLSTFRNRAFRRILLVQMTAKLGMNFWSACYSYFIVYLLLIQKSYASGTEMVGKIVAIVCLVVWVGWMGKKGFHTPWYAATFGAAACIVAFVAVGYGSQAGILPLAAVMAAYPVIFAIWKFFYAGVQYLPDVPLNYVPDVDEMITLRRREGIYSSAQRLVGQLMQAIPATVFAFVLASSGFISTKGNSADVVQPVTVPLYVGLTLLIGVAGLLVLSAVFAHKLDIDKETCEILTKEVARVRGGGRMEDVDPEVKRVCEGLTGIPYEKCFAHNNIGYQEKSVVAAA